MNALDSAHWSWPRLAAASGAWALAVTLAAAWLFVRAMQHAKETGGGEGAFITTLPYGTRHLTIYLAAALLPPLAALARKLIAG